MLEEDLLAQSTTIDFSELCEKLEKLVRDPALRLRMGKAARQFAKDRCSWRVIVNRYEELWQESSQMAKAVCRGGNIRSPVLSTSLEKCFGHFASTKRSAESKCFITAEGREWLRRPDRFYFLCPLHGRLSPHHFGELLRTIGERPGVPLGQVIDLACSDDLSTSVDEMHWTLARLFKYGLVMSGEDRSRARPRAEFQSGDAEVA
jgi:hypothetical protein